MPPPGPERPGRALAALRGLLEISRLTRCQVAIDDVLARIAAIVGRELEFAVVSINAYRPERDAYEVVAVHGPAAARASLLGQVHPAASLAPLLDVRYERRGAYFIPEGALACEPEITWYRSPSHAGRALGESAWRTEDALVVPLLGTGGRNLGLISVDDPASGLRPDDEQLEVLAVFSAHAALAIESARQVHELQASLTRNRAVLRSSLDGVIAMDARGAVVEFNAAAERMFGYCAEQAIGRDLSELLLAADERASVRRAFIAGLAPDGELLGCRREMTVARADGGRVPIEFAVTRVDDGEGPTYYGFVRDISERRRSEAELAHLAYHDSLTGLPNRAQIERELHLALARARRAGTTVALMFIDLDDFKAVNDRLGHAAGDRFLIEVATRLRSVLRDGDVLARQGGDEFLVLLCDLVEDPRSVVEAVGAKLLGALRAPVRVAGQRLRTGASIGVSLAPTAGAQAAALAREAGAEAAVPARDADAQAAVPARDADAQAAALARDADAAMYRAKAQGGGQLVLSGACTSLHTPMAVPKQKQSHARTAQRRAQHKLSAPTYNACPQCHSPRRPHRVCPTCGHYDGREIIAEPGPQSA